MPLCFIKLLSVLTRCDTDIQSDCFSTTSSFYSYSLMGPSITTYASRGRRGVKPPIHFYCVLHAKRGEEGPNSIKIAYVINGRPLSYSKLLIIDGRSNV